MRGVERKVFRPLKALLTELDRVAKRAAALDDDWAVTELIRIERRLQDALRTHMQAVNARMCGRAAEDWEKIG